MQYQIIEPNNINTFNDPQHATKKEGKEFFQWFMSVKDERIRILEKAVQTTPGFENWKADFTEKSLKELGKWLPYVATLVPKTEEMIRIEEESFKGVSPIIPEISKIMLSSQSVSISFDVGIYFTECVKHNNPNKKLDWVLFQKSPRWVDHNSPILGFSDIGINAKLVGQNLLSIAAEGVDPELDKRLGNSSQSFQQYAPDKRSSSYLLNTY